MSPALCLIGRTSFTMYQQHLRFGGGGHWVPGSQHSHRRHTDNWISGAGTQFSHSRVENTACHNTGKKRTLTTCKEIRSWEKEELKDWKGHHMSSRVQHLHFTGGKCSPDQAGAGLYPPGVRAGAPTSQLPGQWPEDTGLKRMEWALTCPSEAVSSPASGGVPGFSTDRALPQWLLFENSTCYFILNL